VRPNTLSSLAEALGVTVDYLVRGGAADVVMLGHRALLYDTDEEFLNTTAPFLAEGIERSEAALVVTTSTNIALLRQRLGSIAGQVEFAEAASWYQTPPSALQRYRAFLNAKLDAGAPWIRIIGEPVWTGRPESDLRLWTRYESLINLVFSAAAATILCPYDVRSLAPEIVRLAGVTHPHMIGPDGLTISPEYADPSGIVLGP
jgi:hypothetical protein